MGTDAKNQEIFPTLCMLYVFEGLERLSTELYLLNTQILTVLGIFVKIFLRHKTFIFKLFVHLQCCDVVCSVSIHFPYGPTPNEKKNQQNSAQPHSSKKKRNEEMPLECIFEDKINFINNRS